MNVRKLKFNEFDYNHISSLDSLKIEIMKKLKIIDNKKNCVPEFEERLRAYLSRNSNQVLNLTLNLTNIERNIKILVTPKYPYPVGFDFRESSNMMWVGVPDPRTSEEIESIKNDTSIKLGLFKDGVAEILSISNTQLKVTYTGD